MEKSQEGWNGARVSVAEQLNSLHNFHGRQVLMRNARSPCDGSIPSTAPPFRLPRETPRGSQFVGLDALKRQGYAACEGYARSDRKVSTHSVRAYIYISVVEDSRGGDLMGIRPVDDFDETFDSKLAGYDSINFSDFLFRERVFAFVQVLICLYIYI